MVLNDAASPTASFTDDSPASDFDPYSSSTPASALPPSTLSTPPGYTLDLSKLPAPLPLIGTLFGFSPARRTEAILGAFASMSAIVQRPLSAEECDSIAYHLSRGAAIHSWGEPLGLAAGYYRYNATRAEFSFPFWKPNLEKLNRERFLGLRGARARVAWDLVRLGAYGGLSGWLGKMIVGSYAATVVAVGQRSDSRMADVVERIGKVGNEEAGRRARSTPEWDRRRGGQRGGQRPERAAAQSEMGAQVEDYGGIQPGGDVQGVPADGNTRVQNRASTFQMEKAETRPAGFDFDDASPTAGADPARPSGSAWDQLRRGGASPSAQPRPQQSRPQAGGRQTGDAWASMRGGNNAQAERQAGSTVGDSFQATGSQGQRDMEKESAQREFDERVERERRGEGFDGDAPGGRWK